MFVDCIVIFVIVSATLAIGARESRARRRIGDSVASFAAANAALRSYANRPAVQNGTVSIVPGHARVPEDGRADAVILPFRRPRCSAVTARHHRRRRMPSTDAGQLGSQAGTHLETGYDA
ncbi:MAG TPA: hypothetical protein VGP92_06795 [Acidimicrobiia bacterium]|nr:hypothetical protein [Acidimicrobiia bacterium]